MTTADIDAAIAAIKAATGQLRTAPRGEIEPSELAATIGATRELLWNVSTLTGVLADRYRRLGPVRHDQGDDPAATLEMIGLRLGDVRNRLTELDDALDATHDLSARLARA